MATYRVRPGFKHGSSNEFLPGDLVELDEEAAYGFRDKLELVQPEPEEPSSKPAENDDAAGSPAVDSDIDDRDEECRQAAPEMASAPESADIRVDVLLAEAQPDLEPEEPKQPARRRR